MDRISFVLERDLTLALTACINPQGMQHMEGVSKGGPHEREADYLACLRYYITHHPRVRRLLFIENSNWPLDRMRTALDENPHHKDVEFISLDCNNYPREWGKGYGEFMLLDRGFDASKLARTTPYFGKLTGRNYVMNLDEILGAKYPPFDLLCDIRDHNLYEILHLPYCGHHADVRLMVFSRRLYEKAVRGCYISAGEANQSFWAEKFFYNLAKDPPAGMRVVPRFALEPKYRGMAGHWNKNYGSPRELTKQCIRATARRLVPWLRI